MTISRPAPSMLDKAPVDSEVPATPAGRPIGRLVGFIAFGVAAVAVIAYEMSNLWDIDWYFDEMWRVTSSTSTNPFTLQMDGLPAPVPTGTLYWLRSWLFAFGDTPTVSRLSSAAAALMFVAAMVAVFSRTISTRPIWGPSGRSIAWVVAPLSAIAVLLLPASTLIYNYVNGYYAESAYLAILVLLTVNLGRRPWVWPVLGGLVVVSPVFMLGGLFGVPAVVAAIAWWAWGSTDRRRRLVTLAGVCVGTVVVAAAMAKVYGASADPGLTSAWADDIWGPNANGSLWTVTKATLAQWVDGFFGLARVRLDGVVGAVVFIALFGVGAVSIGRRQPAVVAVAMSAQFLVLVAAPVMDWPMTPARPNVPWVAIVYAIALFGAFRLVSMAVRERVVATVALGLVPLLLLWHPAPVPTQEYLNVDVKNEYARGLNEDLQVIADNAADENLILSYHFMSHWYPDQMFVNRDWDQRFEVVADTGPALYDEVDALVVNSLDAGGMLWCIIPFDLGPDSSDAACQSSSKDLTEVIRFVGERATIVGAVFDPD